MRMKKKKKNKKKEKKKVIYQVDGSLRGDGLNKWTVIRATKLAR